MNIKKRIKSIVLLGKFLQNDSLESIVHKANSKNNWFTPQNNLSALRAIGKEFLDENKLTPWIEKYNQNNVSLKIGVVMAGNIPAVGFHDALCVLISGHKLLAKLSSEDQVMMTFLLEKLIEIEPEWQDYISFVDRINEADAYIATGSDNTARYFEYYFAKKPHIIRKNRTSVGIIDGHETKEELANLGVDILQYFGLGCRNVSKIYVPNGYKFDSFYEAIENQAPTFINHHKYFNNYEYNKSVYLINQEPHFDNGFLMLRKSESLVSPISVLFYENYESQQDLKQKIETNQSKIQCVVSNNGWFENSIAFGQAQKPSLEDYADGVNTMEFLKNI